MKLMDYHLHSEFSYDSKMKLEDLVEYARENSLDIIVTDHYDVSSSEKFKDHTFDVDQYEKRLRELGIPMGVEFGWDCRTKIKLDLKRFDFVILAIHEYDPPADYGQKRSYLAYLEKLLYAVENVEDFHVIAHLDFPRRYNPHHEPFSKELFPLIEEIFRKIVRDGKGIEVNTDPIYSSYGEPNPSPEIIKLFKECGGEFITVGSDAHELKDVGKGVRSALNILKEVGFKYVSVFRNGRWEKEKIDL